MTEQSTFDYIIVGAGSAGCVIARRLSEDATVLLLEAGPPDSAAIIHNPSDMLKIIFDPTLDVPYETEKQMHLYERQITIYRGIVRGGCSSTGGLVYVRGNRRNYDDWAEQGNEGWSYDEVLPYFKKSEDYWGPPSEYHGMNGPMSVQPKPDVSPAAYAFVQAAAELGYKDSNPAFDFNGARQEDAAGISQVTVTRGGKRASTAVAFLDPIAGRESLTEKNNTVVQRIVIENGRATGVQCVEEGASPTYLTNRTYLASKEVILCAGVFESPRLLMLSGIGPAVELRAHGISTVLDLPGVGKNLQDHLMILLYQLAEGQPGVSTYCEGNLFVNTAGRAETASPDLAFMCFAGMVGLAVDPTTEPNFLFLPQLVRPQSRGEVRLRSSNPADGVIIQPNYLESDADVQVLVRGLDLPRALLSTNAFKALKPKNELFSVPLGETVRIPLPTGPESAIKEFVRRNATTTWSPVGTCKMGIDDLAVVDPQLRVRGVEGLRVADASVIPTTPNGKMNAPSIMIGEKAADMIRGK